MKPQAHYNSKSRLWVISFAIMAIISLLVAVGSTVVYNTVNEKNSKPVDVDIKIASTVSLPVQENNSNVTGVEKALDAQGNVVAYVVTGTVVGYNQESPIQMATTITADATVVTGIEIISQNETEYLGVRIQEDSFKNQFSGRKLPVKTSSSVTKGSGIDVIARSTVSSVAVIEGVNNAQSYVQEFLAE